MKMITKQMAGYCILLQMKLDHIRISIGYQVCMVYILIPEQSMRCVLLSNRFAPSLVIHLIKAAANKHTTDLLCTGANGEQS